MSIDERAARELLEQSDDVHHDAMKVTRSALDELVDVDAQRRGGQPVDRDEAREFHVRRRSLLSGVPAGGLIGALGMGAAFLTLLDRAAAAATSPDVQMLQTAASIENLAVATYGVALGLPFIGGASAIPVVKAFVQKTQQQHRDHAAAFNAAAKQLGGAAQMQPDPVLLGVVNKAKPMLTGPAPVVKLAIDLETGAAQTYVAGTAAVMDKNARATFASIMGVEAQHAAILLAVQALVAGGAPELITLPPDAAKLPAAAGSVGFPDTFYKTDMARPAAEGAVK